MTDHLSDWVDVLPWFSSPAFDEVAAVLARDDELYGVSPAPQSVLAGLSYSPPDGVSAVIIGDDPYADATVATGLAFASADGILPPAMANIHTELRMDWGEPSGHGDLTGWATQGVLLLNVSLSNRNGIKRSHSNIGWSGLIDEIIEAVALFNRHVPFILWGTDATTKAINISNHQHQSVYSIGPGASDATKGFFGSRPFSKTNTYLRNNGKPEIDWGA